MEFAFLRMSYNKMTFSGPALYLPSSIYLPSARLTADTREGLLSHQGVSNHCSKASQLTCMALRLRRGQCNFLHSYLKLFKNFIFKKCKCIY